MPSLHELRQRLSGLVAPIVTPFDDNGAVSLSALSFLGLGVPPRIPAWGSMVSDGRAIMLTAWWVSTLPGIALIGLVIALNLLGEGLRDVLDPRQRGLRTVLPTS